MKTYLKLTCLVLATVFLQISCHAGQEAENRFSAADALFIKRSDKPKAVEALEMYRKLYTVNPGDAEAAWRVSMACYFSGFEVARDKASKKSLFAEGRDAGLQSLKISTGSAPAYFWTAVNMALYGQTVGVLKMLFTLGTVRGYLENSVRLDPAYAYGGGYRILGKIEQELPGLLGGSNERARQYYGKAIEAAPDEPMNYLFMAELVLKVYHDRLKALDFAYKGLGQPEPDESRHESRWARAQLGKFAEEYSAGK
jgi:hypothetical protein